MVKAPASMVEPQGPEAALDPASSQDMRFFGHPRGLRTLFFTEMWERFSYYGMRAILMLFMTAAVVEGGLGFGADKAGPIYAMYTSLVYLATVPGGWLADNFLGQRKSVFFGGIVIMTGHILLAIHGLTSFYAGLGCIVIGTGLLKPNISVIVGQLYSQEDQRRDSGFSIFYMGINLGAFSAPLVCGWLAQNPRFKAILEGWGVDPTNSWHFGFAAAAVGMFFGLLQYVLTGKNLGQAGLRPSVPDDPTVRAKNRRTLWIGIASAVVATVALVWIDSSARHYDRVSWRSAEGGLVVQVSTSDASEPAAALHDGEPISAGELDRFLGQEAAAELRARGLAEEVAGGRAQGALEDVFVRIPDPEAAAAAAAATPLPEPEDPRYASAEEARQEALAQVPRLRIGSVSFHSEGGRLLLAGNTLERPEERIVLAELPASDLGGLSGELGNLKKPLANTVLEQAAREGRATGELTDQHVKVGGLDQESIHQGFMVLLLLTVVSFFGKLFLAGDWTPNERARLVTIFVLFCGAAVFWGIFEQAGSTLTLFADRSTNNSVFGWEFPSSWWQSVNAAMIVILAPFFAWLWISLGRHNPSYPAKFAIGLLFAGLGFALLVGGATLAKHGVLVSPLWLLGVYLLHTIGELFLSPVGLSSMTKLAPARVVSLMMGVWFLAASVGNFIGGSVSGFYEAFPLPKLFAAVAASGVLIAVIMFALVGPIKRMMARSEGATARAH